MAPMTPEEIVGIGREALYVAIQVASPILIVGLIIGLIIGIFQATTQIQEMTFKINKMQINVTICSTFHEHQINSFEFSKFNKIM